MFSIFFLLHIFVTNIQSNLNFFTIKVKKFYLNLTKKFNFTDQTPPNLIYGKLFFFNRLNLEMIFANSKKKLSPIISLVRESAIKRTCFLYLMYVYIYIKYFGR